MYEELLEEKVSVTSSSAAPSGVVNNPNNIRLPTIDLPSFDGSFEKWIEFRELYKSLIHDNNSLPTIQKFHYLRSSLKSVAGNIIDSLSLSEVNYDLAWKMVCDRFNNNKSLVFSHIQAIFAFSKLEKPSCAGLRALIDNCTKHTRCLDSLNVPANHWDLILIYILKGKLDIQTASKWEEYQTEGLPTYKQFVEFIETRAQALESVASVKPQPMQFKPHAKSFIANQSPSCPECNQPHLIFYCPQFKALSPQSRYDHVKSKNLCINCLSSSHSTKRCKSAKSCFKCQNRHHTMLHFDTNLKQTSNTNTLTAATITNTANTQANNLPSNSDIPTTSTFSTRFIQDHILLSTAIVNVYDNYGTLHSCKALLDSGSQSNFITSHFAKRLDIPIKSNQLIITGINTAATHVNHSCNFRFKSSTSDFTLAVECFIVPEITSLIPSSQLDPNLFPIPQDVTLADPTFTHPSNIDVLLGADSFWKVISIANPKITQITPTIALRETKLGWLVTGSIPSTVKTSICHLSKLDSFNFDLAKFWEQEEVKSTPVLSAEEQRCEEHFVSTYSRTLEGRFQVRIPLKESPLVLGDSYSTAYNRFMSLEKRLASNNSLRQEYIKFMEQYIALGHMSLLKSSTVPIYYLPHHGVINENSVTTRLRVVFNGSARTTTGLSLNDIQLVGPTVHQDIFPIITRFRQHRFVVTADITKMFRQINVHELDRLLQCILWRASSSDPLETYSLNTVTYGTASAPFLASRSVLQVGLDCAIEYPFESVIIREDLYVDDAITGCDSEEALNKICNNLSKLFMAACLPLHKWRTNCPTLNIENTPEPLDFSSDSNSKTLGVQWDAISDSFKFTISINHFASAMTKRSLLSAISQVFDPLGVLTPIFIAAKLLMQKLWLAKLDWDDPLDNALQTDWNTLIDNMTTLNGIVIPRYLGDLITELHGFCDASELAMGAVIYAYSPETGASSLVCSKSKVAPLKAQTIPRLELCGALLLSNLMTKVNNSFRNKTFKITMWSDSTIVLGWIRSPPRNFKTFVSHRISEIQELTSHFTWRHIRSEKNPADLISRGVSASQLIENSLWWHGPIDIFNNPSSTTISSMKLPTTLPEQKLIQLVHIAVPTEPFHFLRFSNFKRLIHTFAYCLRFVNNSNKANIKLTGNITPDEFDRSTLKLIKQIQYMHFFKEIDSLKRNEPVSYRSSISSLNPFLDDDQLIRVGGRLRHSNLSFDEKFPLVLPAGHQFVKLLFAYEHVRLGHAGPHQTLYSIRSKYWPLRGKDVAKQTVHKCIRCFKTKPTLFKPLLGDLPEPRVTVNLPFTYVGVDYCGPFQCKDRSLRNFKIVKVYLAIFVCLSTKATHLELVSSLSTEAFIATLRRFISRRGMPTVIGNGTSFVGARNLLRELGTFLRDNDLAGVCAQNDIVWKFIPPHSPHMGGIWEAAVRSAKAHLKQIVGLSIFDFEQYSTLFHQIEAILNSRPLYQISEDPNDMKVLTPSHFLIGKVLTDLPSRDLSVVPSNRLKVYQQIQKLKQIFWKRWSVEYLNTLQTRYKNKRATPNINLDDLILIKDNQLPPLCWQLGRVEMVHPGPDNTIRVATIKTTSGIIKRAVRNLCKLPSIDIEPETVQGGEHV